MRRSETRCAVCLEDFAFFISGRRYKPPSICILSLLRFGENMLLSRLSSRIFPFFASRISGVKEVVFCIQNFWFLKAERLVCPPLKTPSFVEKRILPLSLKISCPLPALADSRFQNVCGRKGAGNEKIYDKENNGCEKWCFLTLREKTVHKKIKNNRKSHNFRRNSIEISEKV